MRTIKFRGKTFGGKWVEGYFMAEKSTGKHKITDGLLDIDVVREETIGQYTGLKDVDGKDIYEGDIIANGMDDIRHIVSYEDKEGAFIGTIPGLHDALGQPIDTNLRQWWLSKNGKRVIGNIHDNPELLEPTKK